MIFAKTYENEDRDIQVYEAAHADLHFVINRFDNPNLSDRLHIYDHANARIIAEMDIPKPTKGMMEYHYGR